MKYPFWGGKEKIKKLLKLILAILTVFGLAVMTTAAVSAADDKTVKFISVLTAAEENHIEKIDCSGFGLTPDEVSYCLSFVEIYNPYLYGVNEFIYSESGKGLIDSISLIYEYSEEEMLRQKAEIDKAADEITALTEGLENPEKVKVVYDYFADSNVYDYKLRVNDEEYNIYTLFTENRGMCKTYALAFKVIMDKLDIPCKVISNLKDFTQFEQNSGTAYHVWNKVYVGDKWFTIDLTQKLYLANDLLSLLRGLKN